MRLQDNGRTMAVGASDGSTTVLRLSAGLADMQANEKPAFLAVRHRQERTIFQPCWRCHRGFAVSASSWPLVQLQMADDLVVLYSQATQAPCSMLSLGGPCSAVRRIDDRSFRPAAIVVEFLMRVTVLHTDAGAGKRPRAQPREASKGGETRETRRGRGGVQGSVCSTAIDGALCERRGGRGVARPGGGVLRSGQSREARDRVVMRANAAAGTPGWKLRTRHLRRTEQQKSPRSKGTSGG